MKKLKNLMLVALIGMSVLGTWSCNNEELYEEPLAVMEDESNEDVDDAVTDVNSPCDFTLENLEANSTVVVNCIIDLQGESLDLPENVTLLYEGGDIINGTLVFSEGSSIDGDLLGNTLEVGGTKPALRDTAFAFDPKRWGIVEGVVSDEVAFSNRDILENTMELAKQYGIDTFKIDEMDAYFKTDHITDHPAETAINVPSDFHLIMTDNTHLRQQPNANKRATLLAAYLISNTIIEGGNLHGDRDTHDYSDTSTSQEWGHCIRVGASKNVIIKNMNIYDAGGDGIDIHAYGHAYNSHYTYTENLLITNNKIYRSRRNGISITDGRNIVIEDNEFIDSGVSTSLSGGVAPGWAIDVEAVRNSGVIFEIAEDILIKNNVERGSKYGGFIIHTGDRVTIDGNTMENSIAYAGTIGSVIKNNNLKSNSETALRGQTTGIIAQNKASSKDNSVYGNTVYGYPIGIKVGDTNLNVYNNNILECAVGISLNTSKDSRIYGNTIKSTTANSRGISNHTHDYISNLIIGSGLDENNESAKSNVIDVVGNAIVFNGIKEIENSDTHSIIIKNNIIENGANLWLIDINNFEMHDNVINTDIRAIDIANASITGNFIEDFKIGDGCSNLNIENNTVCLSLASDILKLININNTCK
ncbi:parallel beta-helix repeat (two copies) [Algibacter lectus]|uniref:right-handed parallel beta-helix repeat-containing protein n=1 Tax=Algibacter lectus TaxID=221126 RepID=UPI0008F35507|nr:right-handed parallel beta-helix repeat-containing protein [Algibacter lectus]SFC35669.1 parallel beta-helix repeat (two copies) [Algibacter lectus]